MKTRRFARAFSLIVILAAAALMPRTGSYTAHAGWGNICKCIPTDGLRINTWYVGDGHSPSVTFITNEETVCNVYATAVYLNSADTDIRPKSSDWKLNMTHGFQFEKTEYVFPENFAVSAKGEGDEHTYKKHPNNGRNNKPMWIVIQFHAKYRCPYACAICPNACPYPHRSEGEETDHYAIIMLVQDSIDQMRQEYIDHGKHGIEIPSYGEMVEANGFYVTRDKGYEHMLDKGLEGFRADWAAECQKMIRDMTGNLNAAVLPSNLVLTSGYRNPEHNEHVYVGNPPEKDPPYVNWDSQHQYGVAMDVVIIDMNGNGLGDSAEDGRLMKEAAWNSFRNHGLDPYKGEAFSYVQRGDRPTYVHADWRGLR